MCHVCGAYTTHAVDRDAQRPERCSGHAAAAIQELMLKDRIERKKAVVNAHIIAYGSRVRLAVASQPLRRNESCTVPGYPREPCIIRARDVTLTHIPPSPPLARDVGPPHRDHHHAPDQALRHPAPHYPRRHERCAIFVSFGLPLVSRSSLRRRLPAMHLSCALRSYATSYCACFVCLRTSLHTLPHVRLRESFSVSFPASAFRDFLWRRNRYVCSLPHSSARDDLIPHECFCVVCRRVSFWPPSFDPLPCCLIDHASPRFTLSSHVLIV